MKKIKKKKLIINLLAILTLPIVIFYTSYTISNQPEIVSIKEEVIAPRVTIERITAGTHRSIIEAYAEVKSSETLTLLGQVSGQVTWQSEYFTEGQRIKKNDLLVRIKETNYQVALANAEKQMADAHLILLQESRKYDRAQSDWKRSGITAKPNSLVLRKPQMEIARTQYAAAKQAVALAKQNLDDTKIYAPFDAVITAKNVTAGSYLSEGGAIGELKAIEIAEIKVALSEREWQQLPTPLNSLPVKVISTGNTHFTWKGVVSDLSMVIDPSTRTRTLSITVDSPLEEEKPLLFGRFVNIRIQGKASKNSFVVSSSSLTADGFIWYEKNKKLFKHKAQPLFHSLKTVGIAQGNLSDTLNLVMKPMSHYVEGMEVMSFRTDMEIADAK